MFFLRSFVGLWWLLFLPGFVGMLWIKYRASVVHEVIVAAGLSLAINYMVTYALFAFSMFAPGWYVGLFGMGLVALVFFLVRDMRESREAVTHDLWVVSSGLGVLVFLWVLNQFVAKSGSIPWAGDDLFGWNGWALRWFRGDPVWSQPNFYPQMLPITWAVSYLWSATERIYFFARSIMPFFFFGILGMGWDLWWKKRDIPSLAGMMFLLLLFVVWKDFPRMTMGIADIPAAFFAFSAFVVLIEALDDKSPQGVVLAGILATMASLTKQYGLLYLGAFVGIVGVLVFVKGWWKETLWRGVVLFVVVFAALWAGLWYGVGFFREGYIQRKVGDLVTQGAFEAYQQSPDTRGGFSLTRGWKAAEGILTAHFRGRGGVLVVGAGWAFSLGLWPWLLWGWLVVVPAFLAWMLLIAYDIRNVSIGLVFFLFLAGIGWGTILHFVFQKAKVVSRFFGRVNERIEQFLRVFSRKVWLLLFVLGMLVVLVGVWSGWYSYERLETIQKERMKRYLGNYRDLNAMVYDVLAGETNVPLYGEYAFFAFFPDVLYHKIDFKRLESVQEVVQSGERGYLVWVANTPLSPEVLAYLEASERRGRIKRVGQCESGIMWQLSGKKE
ncbi:hypothetical protein [Thermospira aquatica]|uniref:Glycosyltransferase RgtA/B/C/D-like domain-containing protein n=1 Tax=Thermospira aquatica TaxID=2828656 RepID=A0AAX3BER0_9SPIR|nr:hypothetical protein [Thermospira aquatica]URA10842.1 hypothetical protein KDW03_03285 [Thermospira aquatica]